MMADKKTSKKKAATEVDEAAPVAPAPPAPKVIAKPKIKIAKLAPKNKSRLPRRQKKAAKKAAAV